MDYVVEEPKDVAEDDAAAAELAEPVSFDPKTPMISLRAIAGIRMVDTMQLYVTFGNEQFVVLLDSGSTHNFICGDNAHCVGLQFMPYSGVGVIVANGDRAECRGIARDVSICIADESFHIDCSSIPINTYDMVLGVMFLHTLGPIL